MALESATLSMICASAGLWKLGVETKSLLFKTTGLSEIPFNSFSQY